MTMIYNQDLPSGIIPDYSPEYKLVGFYELSDKVRAAKIAEVLLYRNAKEAGQYELMTYSMSFSISIPEAAMKAVKVYTCESYGMPKDIEAGKRTYCAMDWQDLDALFNKYGSL